MGLLSDIVNAILGDGSSNVSTDSKSTSYTVDDDGGAKVRNSSVIVDHDKGTHDMFWSTTESKPDGSFSVKEGGHGPNYQK